MRHIPKLILLIIFCTSSVFPQDKSLELLPDQPEWNKSKKNSEELINLLLNPLNLQVFKKLKIQKSNSGGGRSDKYLFKPNYNGFYYSYFFFPGFCEHGPRITTYKRGKEIGDYMEVSETFIQLVSDTKDKDLGNANILSLTQKQILDKFGENYIKKDNILIYQHNKTLLIISFGDNRWFKIVRLKQNYSSFTKIEMEKGLISYF